MPAAGAIVTAPATSFARFRVTSAFAPRVFTVIPPFTVSVLPAAWVTLPLESTVSAPDTVEAPPPKEKAVLSRIETLLPLAIRTLPRLFVAFVSVMSFAPAASVVAPVTVSGFACVIGPAAVTLRLPDTARGAAGAEARARSRRSARRCAR